MMDFDYLGTWKDVMKSPSHFYSEMPKTGGYTDPFIFAAINVAIYSLFYLLLIPELTMSADSVL